MESRLEYGCGPLARTVRKPSSGCISRASSDSHSCSPPEISAKDAWCAAMLEKRRQIAWRAAQDLADGAYVNLGIGLPTLIADYIPADRDIVLHSENGILGVWPVPGASGIDWDLINAGWMDSGISS